MLEKIAPSYIVPVNTRAGTYNSPYREVDPISVAKSLNESFSAFKLSTMLKCLAKLVDFNNELRKKQSSFKPGSIQYMKIESVMNRLEPKTTEAEAMLLDILIERKGSPNYH